MKDDQNTKPGINRIEMQSPFEPGEFEIQVDNSPRDADLQKLVLTVA